MRIGVFFLVNDCDFEIYKFSLLLFHIFMIFLLHSSTKMVLNEEYLFFFIFDAGAVERRIIFVYGLLRFRCMKIECLSMI